MVVMRRERWATKLRRAKTPQRIREIAVASAGAVRAALSEVLHAQAEQAAEEVLGGGRDFRKFAADWAQQLYDAKRPHAYAASVDGYRLTQAGMGKSIAIRELEANAIDIFMAEVDETAELIARRMNQAVDEYLHNTSKLETQTSIDRLNAIYQRGVAENNTTAEIARDFMHEGASSVAGRARAELMARTINAWAYVHGSMEAYAEAGARSQWLASADACPEICLPLDGVIADEGGLFNGQSFPGHPNCQCDVVPVMED